MRLRGLAEGEHGAAVGVCGTTAEAAGTPGGLGLRAALGNHCLDGRLIDTDLAAPGLQPDCEVHADDRVLPTCENPNAIFGEPGPCWAIHDDAAACGDFPSRLAVEINWGEVAPVTAEVDCVVVPDVEVAQ